MRIEACYDSHVHWLAVGEFVGRLHLEDLPGPAQIGALKVEPGHMRGEWLLGFGWNDNDWSQPPHRRLLDEVFPDRPVALTRCDGHALWVNSVALRQAGLLDHASEVAGGRIDRDPDGTPTGVLVDNAMAAVEKHIPQLSAFEVRRDLLKGVHSFHRAGFTHIRDMTCNEAQWNEAVKLDEAGLLTLAVEEYFWLKSMDQFPQILKLAQKARASQTENLRVHGLKIFLDGALGSEGAWLSQCYHGSDAHGLVLWEREPLREVILSTWNAGLAVALHAIGDETVDWLVKLVRELKAQGHSGAVHVEHAELVRPETVELMRGLDLQCHMQPAHWLSDRAWLKDKIGDLSAHAFPWRKFEDADIAFDFGSDAPIEPANFFRTLQALTESSAHGIPALKGEATSYMGHRDLAWAPNSFTVFDEQQPKQVVFRGENII